MQSAVPIEISPLYKSLFDTIHQLEQLGLVIYFISKTFCRSENLPRACMHGRQHVATEFLASAPTERLDRAKEVFWVNGHSPLRKNSYL